VWIWKQLFLHLYGWFPEENRSVLFRIISLVVLNILSLIASYLVAQQFTLGLVRFPAGIFLLTISGMPSDLYSVLQDALFL
jgi:hypothetical protein